MSINVAPYKKFVAAIAAVVAVFAIAVSDGSIDTQEGAGIVSSIIGAAAVFGLRNKALDAVKNEADALFAPPPQP